MNGERQSLYAYGHAYEGELAGCHPTDVEKMYLNIQIMLYG